MQWIPVSAKADTVTGFSYEPPILPLQFSASSNGAISVTLTQSCVTPIGRFSIGLGINNVSKSAGTFFIVRNKDSEDVYCVGTGGTLRLASSAKSVIDITAAQDHPNTFYIDVREADGDFLIEFIPDPNAKTLAGVETSSYYHWLYNFDLQKDGSIDTGIHIPLASIDSLSLESMDKNNSKIDVTYVDDSGMVRNRYGYLTSDLLLSEARWLLCCFRQIQPDKCREIREAADVSDKSNLRVFDDGSLDSNSIFVPGLMITDIFEYNNIIVVTLDRPFGDSADDTCRKIAFPVASDQTAHIILDFERKLLIARADKK
jgi:hypothetical protein